VSNGSGSRLPNRKGSGAPRVLRLRILPPYREGSSVVTACLVAPCGPWASSIMKSLAGMCAQSGSHVPNARAYVPKAADVRVIMGLQDVGAGGAFNVCKTCG
jgi:hypothetical protein